MTVEEGRMRLALTAEHAIIRKDAEPMAAVNYAFRLRTFNDRYWSGSREPQRSMTSRGYDPRQSPGLGYKRVVSCKDSFHGTDVLAVSEHGASGRRPNIHAHVVGRQREGALKTAQPSGARARTE